MDAKGADTTTDLVPLDSHARPRDTWPCTGWHLARSDQQRSGQDLDRSSFVKSMRVGEHSLREKPPIQISARRRQRLKHTNGVIDHLLWIEQHEQLGESALPYGVDDPPDVCTRSLDTRVAQLRCKCRGENLQRFGLPRTPKRTLREWPSHPLSLARGQQNVRICCTAHRTQHE